MREKAKRDDLKQTTGAGKRGGRFQGRLAGDLLENKTGDFENYWKKKKGFSQCTARSLGIMGGSAPKFGGHKDTRKVKTKPCYKIDEPELKIGV